MSLTWSSSLTRLPAVGEKTATVLKKAGLATVGDLLNYLPTRFEDTRHVLTLTLLWQYIQDHGLPLVVGKTIIVKAKIDTLKLIRVRGRKLTIVQGSLIDAENPEAAPLPVLWFNQPFIATSYKSGDEVIIKGQLKQDKKKLLLYPVDVERYYPGKKMLHVGRLTPVYRQVSGISTKLFRRWQLNAVDLTKIDDPIPPQWREEAGLVTLAQGYRLIHNPQKWSDLNDGLSRLAIQELIELHANFSTLKDQYTNKALPFQTTRHKKVLADFMAQLPFALTPDQKNIYEHWLEHADKAEPLDCLICGDVGSGKTIAVFLLMLITLLNGYSVIVTAPTSVLAEQHYRTFTSWLTLVPELQQIPVQLITARTRAQPLRQQQSVIVGTQALLFRDNLPSDTGLLVVDEQHKFGVEQRRQLLSLIEKRSSASVPRSPHVVTLSATPIPRTMALYVFGYQSALYIDTLPSQRLPVQTHLVKPERQDDLSKWIAGQIKENKTQVFMVYPLVQENETLGILSAEEAYQQIKKKFPKTKIGLLHGQLKVQDKGEIIEQFRQKKLDMLVTTTVIEVGIDIPNANIMVIHYPERYGLAQLHQLRGRVGRGGAQGYCYLTLSDTLQENQVDRLHYFATHTDGWKISEYDLRHRGPGELYGQLQAGASELRIASSYNATLIKASLALWQKLQKAGRTLPQRFFLEPIVK